MITYSLNISFWNFTLLAQCLEGFFLILGVQLAILKIPICRGFMEWTQFSIFFIGVFGLFIWNRAESRADIRHMDIKLEGQRNLMNSIHDEMKDFHSKLIQIEKNRK